MFFERIARVLIAACIALVSHVALAQAPQKVLNVISQDLNELDPTQGSNRIARVYSQMVFDTLFALDGKLAPQPMMVERFTTSADGLVRTYTLRKNLKFHDGTPITAHDVVASIKRWADNTGIGGQLKSRLASPLGIEDALTFRLTLKEPFGQVEFLLAGGGAPIPGIMREKDARRPYNTPMPLPVVGSGPFRYVDAERIEGSRAVFARNPDYVARQEPPDGLAGSRVVKVDKVVWMVMPDATTAASALIAGEADLWSEADPDQLGTLKSKGIQMSRNGLPFVWFVRPNHQVPPFNDPRARQALALLVDAKEMMPIAAGDADWKACHAFTVCGSVYSTEVGSEPFRKPDLKRAKELMAQAGYKGETLVMVATLGRDTWVAQVLAQRLKDIGVKVDVQPLEFPALLQRVRAKGKPVGQGGYNLFGYNATGSLWFHPLTNVALDMSCGGKNWQGYPCDEKSEALRQKFFQATTPVAQKAAFEALQRDLWRSLPYIPVGQWDVVNAYRSNISGVSPAYVQAFWNIDKR
ncbi:MAG TPA: ABC transporter substrate-binding protein [Ramlibacter sp.]|uniref:ABC transporter substrate-binding protein n=1 Tax=Ramlibacter sp. TaxID=1917967 RepID=UPI002CFAD2DA|nr:ABC transporter substrate-binding protein [Ramlibacter sp.]HVZ46604.1 ABC transporter substrate-binding protein [Ramlibacter sp.]